MLRPPLHLQSGAGIFLPTICGVVQSIRQRKDGQGLGSWYCPSDRCKHLQHARLRTSVISPVIQRTPWRPKQCRACGAHLSLQPLLFPPALLPLALLRLKQWALETRSAPGSCHGTQGQHKEQPEAQPWLEGPQTVDATSTDHRECSDQKEREVLAGGQEIFPTGGGKQWPSPGAKPTILELRGELV